MCLFCSVLCTSLSLWCSDFARTTGQQPSPDPLLHLPHSACSLCFIPIGFEEYGMARTIIRETISPDCLCWEKHLLIHGLATALVELTVEQIACTPLPSISFCSHEEDPLCLLLNITLCLAWASKNKWVIAQAHIILSCVRTVLVHLEKHTPHLAKNGIPFIKNNELHFGLTPVLLKLCSC